MHRKEGPKVVAPSLGFPILEVSLEKHMEIFSGTKET